MNLNGLQNIEDNVTIFTTNEDYCRQLIEAVSVEAERDLELFDDLMNASQTDAREDLAGDIYDLLLLGRIMHDMSDLFMRLGAKGVSNFATNVRHGLLYNLSLTENVLRQANIPYTEMETAIYLSEYALNRQFDPLGKLGLPIGATVIRDLVLAGATIDQIHQAWVADGLQGIKQIAADIIRRDRASGVSTLVNPHVIEWAIKESQRTLSANVKVRRDARREKRSLDKK